MSKNKSFFPSKAYVIIVSIILIAVIILLYQNRSNELPARYQTSAIPIHATSPITEARLLSQELKSIKLRVKATKNSLTKLNYHLAIATNRKNDLDYYKQVYNNLRKILSLPLLPSKIKISITSCANCSYSYYATKYNHIEIETPEAIEVDSLKELIKTVQKRFGDDNNYPPKLISELESKAKKNIWGIVWPGGSYKNKLSQKEKYKFLSNLSKAKKPKTLLKIVLYPTLKKIHPDNFEVSVIYNPQKIDIYIPYLSSVKEINFYLSNDMTGKIKLAESIYSQKMSCLDSIITKIKIHQKNLATKKIFISFSYPLSYNLYSLPEYKNRLTLLSKLDSIKNKLPPLTFERDTVFIGLTNYNFGSPQIEPGKILIPYNLPTTELQKLLK